MIIEETFHINLNNFFTKHNNIQNFGNIIDHYTVKRGDTLTKILEKELKKANITVNKKEFNNILKKVIKENRIKNPDLIHPGQKIVINLKKKSKNLFPVDGVITSRFGPRLDPFTKKIRFHQGLDIAAPEGTPIKSTINGIVIFSGKIRGYGNIVIIKNGDTVTKYAHNKVNLVKKGDYVKKDQVIAQVGSTGRSTGSHLHFEVVVHHKHIDPLKFLSS